MPLTSGTKLDRYEVVEPIGAGGMGEVYRARDTKLGRDIAIKVLPEEFARDKERVDRFEREARLLAQLNHANVATLHGLEEHDGQQFLVMELVEGETLAERIAEGPIPVDEAVSMFIQIAEGLEAAHEKGIIHRDLKPANIKIGPDGKPKILDFGLAKAFVDDTGTALDSSQSPTLTKGTALGAIIGTASYMSPEQARGKKVDQRTDIWAFGCCLYEVVAGRKAFDGETVADVIGAVVHKEPDWSRLPSLSYGLDRVLRRCLTKDMRQRLHAIGDARLDLGETTSKPPDDNGGSARSRHVGALALTFGVGVASASVVAWLLWPSLPDSPEPVVPRQLTSNPLENSVASAAISPDGRYLAFADGNGLFLRLIETGETHRVDTPVGFELSEIDWYPDGTSLLFTSNGAEGQSLWRIPVLGGEPRRVGDFGWRASVSPTGSHIAYFKETPARAIYVVAPNGENPRTLATADGNDSFWELAWSPDGAWVVYGNTPVSLTGTRLEAIRLDGTDSKVVLSDPNLFQYWRGVLPFCWTPDDRLVYALRGEPPHQTSSNLWAVGIDPSTAQIQGRPSRLTHVSGFNVRDVAVTSDATRLTFLLERNQADIFVSELPEGGIALLNAHRLTLDDRDDFPSGWLSDSRTVLYWSDRAGSFDPYRQRLDEVLPTSLHNGVGLEREPRLSADGEWIMFWTGEDLMRTPAAGGPPERTLTWTGARGFESHQVHCAVRQRCLLGGRDESGSEYVFWTLDPIVGRGEELARIEDRRPFVQWRLSPDGGRVAIVHRDGAVRVVDLDGGTEHEFRHENWIFGEYVSWDSSGQGVYVDAHPRGQRDFRQQIVHVRFGEEVEVSPLRGDKEQWHMMPTTSPDGRYLAYGVMTYAANAWMLEDF